MDIDLDIGFFLCSLMMMENKSDTSAQDIQTDLSKIKCGLTLAQPAVALYKLTLTLTLTVTLTLLFSLQSGDDGEKIGYQHLGHRDGPV